MKFLEHLRTVGSWRRILVHDVNLLDGYVRVNIVLKNISGLFLHFTNYFISKMLLHTGWETLHYGVGPTTQTWGITKDQDLENYLLFHYLNASETYITFLKASNATRQAAEQDMLALNSVSLCSLSLTLSSYALILASVHIGLFLFLNWNHTSFYTTKYCTIIALFI
jgi:hypothetical protein